MIIYKARTKMIRFSLIRKLKITSYVSLAFGDTLRMDHMESMLSLRVILSRVHQGWPMYLLP